MKRAIVAYACGQAESRLASSHAVLIEARQIRSTERERLRQAEVSFALITSYTANTSVFADILH